MSTATKYRAKAQDSFRTKLNLYIFHKVISRKLESIDQDDFTNFKIDQELVDLYTTVYWQQETDKKINKYRISEIEHAIKQWNDNHKPLIEEFKQRYIHNLFPTIFPIVDFETLLEEKKCHYCGITEEQILELADKQQLRKKSLRGWSLEIDRHDSNLEYSKKNYVMACYWCNNAKTDEFTSEEFAAIGKEIEKIWSKRLATR